MDRKLLIPILVLLLVFPVIPASAERVSTNEVMYEWKVILWEASRFSVSSKAEILANGTVVLRLHGFLKYEIELPFELPKGSYIMLMAGVSSDSSNLSVIQVKAHVNGNGAQFYNLTVLHGTFFPQFIYFGEVKGKKLFIWIFHHKSIAGNASLLLYALDIELFIPTAKKTVKKGNSTDPFIWGITVHDPDLSKFYPKYVGPSEWDRSAASKIASAGIKMVRFMIFWGDIEREWGKYPDWNAPWGSYPWTFYDKAIEDMVKNNLTPLLIVGAGYAWMVPWINGMPVAPDTEVGPHNYSNWLNRLSPGIDEQSYWYYGILPDEYIKHVTEAVRRIVWRYTYFMPTQVKYLNGTPARVLNYEPEIEVDAWYWHTVLNFRPMSYYWQHPDENNFRYNLLHNLTKAIKSSPGGRILIETYHRGGNIPITAYGPQYNISWFLEKLGYTVTVNKDKPLDKVDLSQYDALIIDEPRWLSYSQAEIDAVRNFVYNGGGLLLAVDTELYYGDQTPNQIAEIFGARFYGDLVKSCTIATFNHPITADKKQSDVFQPFILWDAVIGRYPANATVLLADPGNATGNLAFGNLTSENLPSGNSSDYACMVAINYGKGRVVLGPCNGLTQVWGEAWYGRREWNKLFINTIKWLAGEGLNVSNVKVYFDFSIDGWYLSLGVIPNIALDLKGKGLVDYMAVNSYMPGWILAPPTNQVPPSPPYPPIPFIIVEITATRAASSAGEIYGATSTPTIIGETGWATTYGTFGEYYQRLFIERVVFYSSLESSATGGKAPFGLIIHRYKDLDIWRPHPFICPYNYIEYTFGLLR
ncbi:hypothetical protein D6D85_14925, partial [Candidatus Methanodesulfokora washburnensis]